MRYVLDSSVAVKCVLTELDSDKAIRLRDDARAATHALLAPDVFPVEAGHALTRAPWELQIADCKLQIADCADGFSFCNLQFAICNLQFAICNLQFRWPRAYALSSSMRVGIYDCLYVALAEREGCEFITCEHLICW